MLKRIEPVRSARVFLAVFEAALVLTLAACGSSDDQGGESGTGGGAGTAGTGGGAAGTGAVGGAGGVGGVPTGGTGAAGAGGIGPDVDGGTPPPTDGGMAGAGGAPPVDAGPITGLRVADCFSFPPGIVTDGIAGYDDFRPVVGSHCMGTNHQDIQGVQKLVFLGDSVTEGSPPTGIPDFYRTRLTDQLIAKFGPIEVVECSDWGSRNDDFLIGKNQIGCAFPTGVENKKTLIVFTSGGNDEANWAKNKYNPTDGIVQADAAADLLDEAIAWLTDPAHFPNGSYVVFANVYEYTDATADMSSCPASSIVGLSGTWADGIPVMMHFHRRYVEIAVKYQVDMIFLMEHFCGHGYHAGDPMSPCYRGPGMENWFDLTCIHPTPVGHGKVAELFFATINE